jgi:hypothetical protein
MTLVPLTTCCLSLGIDPKTLRLWLQAAHLSCCPHPSDARLKCLTLAQLQQLAQLHGRPLLVSEATLTPPSVAEPAHLPTCSPETAAVSAGPDETAIGLQLASLQQQVTTLQAQITELALALLSLRSSLAFASPSAPSAAPPAKEDQSISSASPAAVSAPSSVITPTTRSTAAATSRTRKRSRALPLIQVRPDGSLVVIAPKEGVLPLLPDSEEWFAWLASIEAFSFESPTGRFTATRKFRSGQRIQAWTVHCSLHGRSCGLYLGLTPTLTLVRLQEMVAAVRARLTTP